MLPRIWRNRRLCQAALGQLEDEVSRMLDETPAGLEQPLLETRQRPTLNGEGQNKAAQEIAVTRQTLGEHPRARWVTMGCPSE
jgi:hypothetical protein